MTVQRPNYAAHLARLRLEVRNAEQHDVVAHEWLAHAEAKILEHAIAWCHLRRYSRVASHDGRARRLRAALENGLQAAVDKRDALEDAADVLEEELWSAMRAERRARKPAHDWCVQIFNRPGLQLFALTVVETCPNCGARARRVLCPLEMVMAAGGCAHCGELWAWNPPYDRLPVGSTADAGGLRRNEPRETVTR